MNLRQGKALVVTQGENQVARVAVEGEAAGLGKGVEFGVGLGLFHLVGFFDALALGLEVLAVQAQRDFGLPIFDQLGHQLAQLATLPGRQAQGLGPLGHIKVVQIAQVRWHGAAAGHAGHHLLEQGGAATADFAQHKQVVAGLVKPQAKAGGALGPLLADPGQGLLRQLRRVGKAQRLRGDADAQVGRGHAVDGHRAPANG